MVLGLGHGDLRPRVAFPHRVRGEAFSFQHFVWHSELKLENTAQKDLDTVAPRRLETPHDAQALDRLLSGLLGIERVVLPKSTLGSSLASLGQTAMGPTEPKLQAGRWRLRGRHGTTHAVPAAASVTGTG